MQFNSIEYLLFLVAMWLLFFATPRRWRWMWLLAGSYFFYLSFKIEYVVLLLFSTVLTYGTARGIQGSERESVKQLLLGLCVLGNLSVLFYFKYFDFFNEALSGLFDTVQITYQPEPMNLLLPIGISFYTFQVMSYAIDVYLGVIHAEKHFGKFALFVSFFPQLVSGPIERANDLLTQFFEEKPLDYALIKTGLKLIVWGLFKKLVVADRIALYTGLIYQNPEIYNSVQILVATYIYGMQLYCDFSGYIDIARGSGFLLGFRLTDNFKRPFMSRNMTMFFTRWHITLFRWFNDYVFLPLSVQWRNMRQIGVVLAIAITFFLSGIWHGSTWNFVVWGALLGLGMAYEKVTLRWRKKLFSLMPKAVATVLSIFIFMNFVTVLNVVFFGKDLHDAWYMLTHMFTFENLETMKAEGGAALGEVPHLYYAVFPACFVLLREVQQEFFGRISVYSDSKRPLLRYLSYIFVLLMIVMFGVFDGGQFIYYQF